ncbi:MAG: hypothetical protein KF901_02610 [Myxococcales bacterium]|nr:hypothetical protein [Myxococcales bacterium]
MADTEIWTRRVAAWRRSGLTAAEFCRGSDFAASTLRWYASRLGRSGELPTADTSTSVAMVKVGEVRTRERIVVEVDDLHVHVPDGVDAETLRTVFAVLREDASE